MNFGRYKLKRCKHGWMLFCGPYIGKCFDLYGEYSESEVDILRSLVKEGDAAIDVGANIGDLTIPIASLVKDSGRVYAIESNPDLHNVLCANLALNGIRNTRPINALVAHNPSVDTSGVWGKYAFTSEIWDTQVLSIDSLGLSACHLIKIDVDGKELEVLKSADAVIRRHRPVIYFENDQQSQSRELLEHALGLGYALYWHAAPIFRYPKLFRQSDQSLGSQEHRFTDGTGNPEGTPDARTRLEENRIDYRLVGVICDLANAPGSRQS